MNTLLLFCLAVLGTESDSDAALNFDTQIVPVLTKAGCNAGACHGAAAGRGGFHLSLLGSDPEADYYAIVRALEGRRINLSKPELSLILAKPGGRIEHGGDVALPEGEAGEKRLLGWIRAGAVRGAARQLTSFEVTPSRVELVDAFGAVQMQATARFDDGPPEDVTAWTVFTPGDKEAVAVDAESSKLEVRRRGQHVVIARFLDRVLPIQINVPLSDVAVDLAAEPRANFIDDEILKTLTVLRLPVAPAADDAAFLRRVRLDLTGRLPSREEVENYLPDEDPAKHRRLIDRLLESEDFVDYWTLRFARHLDLHGLPNESEGVRTYSQWLRRSMEQRAPLDAMARQLITATGDTYALGPANFARMVPDARSHAELFGRFFLGVRLGCANCHNHPLDKWTQDDYHGLAAVFARLERGRYVQLAPRGSVTNLRTGEAATPRIPGARDLGPEEDQLHELAAWLTSPEQRYFARATVNRLWHAMFGRGLVEPIDDLRDTNPATHPQLLERLADDFLENGADLRHTLRLIALSHTYARGESTDARHINDDRFYARSSRRRLMPEVLADAIADVTGVPDEFSGVPIGTRAVKIVDPLTRSAALDNLGRCSRLVGCDGVAASSTGVATELHLINGDLINRKLVAPQGRLQSLMASHASTAGIVQEFYLRALGRHPTRQELESWSQRLEAESEAERRAQLEDFLWSLLNSRQFTENH